MNYIIMDLEFNQPFDFERGGKSLLVQQLPFEIIQIGAVKMDDAFRVLDTINLMIKPQLYTRMHPFVEKITGLHANMFEDKGFFPEAYESLLQFMGGGDTMFGVWGNSDVKLLYRNISYYQLDASHLTNLYVNIQQLASSFLGVPGGKSIGLKNAIEALNLPTELPFHNALNDAIYTADIFTIVKTDPVQTQIYNPNEVTKPKEKVPPLFDSKRLYAETESRFGRKLSRREKEIIKKVYTQGRLKKFDYPDK